MKKSKKLALLEDLIGDDEELAYVAKTAYPKAHHDQIAWVVDRIIKPELIRRHKKLTARTGAKER